MDNKQMFIKHAKICFSIMVIFWIMLLFQPHSIGFGGSFCFILVGSLFTTIGVFIGDLLRKFAMPDAHLSSGFIDTIKQKVFWKVGPQAVGWIIGMVITNGFLINVLGLSQFA